jgi:hypothetical protein
MRERLPDLSAGSSEKQDILLGEVLGAFRLGHHWVLEGDEGMRWSGGKRQCELEVPATLLRLDPRFCGFMVGGEKGLEVYKRKMDKWFKDQFLPLVQAPQEFTVALDASARKTAQVRVEPLTPEDMVNIFYQYQVVGSEMETKFGKNGFNEMLLDWLAIVSDSSLTTKQKNNVRFALLGRTFERPVLAPVLEKKKPPLPALLKSPAGLVGMSRFPQSREELLAMQMEGMPLSLVMLADQKDYPLGVRPMTVVESLMANRLPTGQLVEAWERTVRDLYTSRRVDINDTTTRGRLMRVVRGNYTLTENWRINGMHPMHAALMKIPERQRAIITGLMTAQGVYDMEMLDLDWCNSRRMAEYTRLITSSLQNTQMQLGSWIRSGDGKDDVLDDLDLEYYRKNIEYYRRIQSKLEEQLRCVVESMVVRGMENTVFAYLEKTGEKDARYWRELVDEFLEEERIDDDGTLYDERY